MPKIVACLNSKGGVGKSTTCVALAEYFSAELEHKTLVLDIDWQTNATSMLMSSEDWLRYQREEKTLAHYIHNRIIQKNTRDLLQDYIINGRSNVRLVRSNGYQPAPPLGIVPGSMEMDEIEFQIIRRMWDDDEALIVDKVSEFLSASIQGLTSFKYVFIDCPPKFDIITKAVAKIMHYAVVPFSHQVLTQYGLERLISRLAQLRNQMPDTIPYGALPTRIRNIPASSASIERVKHKFKVIPASIPEKEEIGRNGEFSSEGGRMTWHEKWGTEGAKQYSIAAREILKYV